mmetsp:Transcript_8007/g.26467  ORF Transcript_8007/g.26467 Transcript_8007/m.26467 type:complete len:201 (-) Transcript_8007:704-1306(-)
MSRPRARSTSISNPRRTISTSLRSMDSIRGVPERRQKVRRRSEARAWRYRREMGRLTSNAFVSRRADESSPQRLRMRDDRPMRSPTPHSSSSSPVAGHQTMRAAPMTMRRRTARRSNPSPSKRRCSPAIETQRSPSPRSISSTRSRARRRARWAQKAPRVMRGSYRMPRRRRHEAPRRWFLVFSSPWLFRLERVSRSRHP